MDIKIVRKKLNQALEAPEDDFKYQAFVNDYAMLLDAVKVNADTANLAIESVTLDNGVNFLDTFAVLEKKQIHDAWKSIRECEQYKKNVDFKALKLMGAFTVSALGGDTNTANILEQILTAVVTSLKLPEQQDIQPEVYPILEETILEMIPKNVKFPEWKSIKITPENMLIFCSVMEKALDLQIVQEKGSKIPASFAVKKWISAGKAYAEEAKELKEREKNKLPKKSNELLKLAQHYKQFEEELDKSILECVKLSMEKKSLQEEIDKLEIDRREKENAIKVLQNEVEGLKSKVSQANQEIDERKRLNDAQVQYREDSRTSLLQDIARALKAEYGDYAETKDAPMSEMLGEIYREKLKQIFKILEQKGIKVEG